ncbi:MAG: hypothetical protein ABSC55_23480, partial [Syntrophorhabdales bacterium]
RRGPTKNWLAKIWRDKKNPGKIKRKFAKPIGAYPERYGYMIPDTWGPGTPVEFGAGHTDKRTHWLRWYGVIIMCDADSIVLYRYNDEDEAIKAASGCAQADQLYYENYLDDLSRAMETWGNVSDLDKSIVQRLIDEVRDGHPDAYMDWWLKQANREAE